MKKLLLLLLLPLAACACAPKIPGAVWYKSMETVCRDPHCPCCHGSGGRMCHRCRGRGEIPCKRCKNGKIRCYRCGGTGFVKKKKKIKKCKLCDGKGRITCPYCGGDGMATCPRCSGKGKLLCIKRIPVTIPEITDPEDAWPPGNLKQE
jgi:hypothetical protein